MRLLLYRARPTKVGRVRHTPSRISIAGGSYRADASHMNMRLAVLQCDVNHAFWTGDSKRSITFVRTSAKAASFNASTSGTTTLPEK